MIDVINEELMDLKAAAKLQPFRNRTTRKPAHVGTMYRFVMQGARASNGERVRLEVVRTPSGLRTSAQAVQRFISELTNPEADVPQAMPVQRQQQIDSAQARLAAAGIA